MTVLERKNVNDIDDRPGRRGAPGARAGRGDEFMRLFAQPTRTRPRPSVEYIPLPHRGEPSGRG
jgi:hypothetical protein